MRGVFVSYRRGETGSHAAARVSDCLKSRFGKDTVFFDVQNIKAGYHFDEQIDEALKQCYSLVVVVDNFWTSAEQIQRLHDPEDFVRREVAAALGRDVLVLPVVIDNAVMPSADMLPDCLKSLSVHQALHLRHINFDEDIGQLFDILDTHYSDLEALRNAMPCPHCHGAVKVSPGDRIAPCPTCGVDVGILRVMLSEGRVADTDGELSRQLKLAAMDFSTENYYEAYNQYNKILEQYSDCWEALANKAVCLFWIGNNDLAHLPEVFRLLEKSALLSNIHPKVREIRRNLVYNLAALASVEDMVGDGITWSLDLFKFCKEMEPDDPDSEALATEYVDRCFDGVHRRLVDLLMRDGKSFDPPLSEISTLRRLMQMSTSDDVIRFFILMADLRLQIHSNNDELLQDLVAAKDKLKRIHPDASTLRVVFPFIGNPKIEEIRS